VTNDAHHLRLSKAKITLISGDLLAEKQTSG